MTWSFPSLFWFELGSLLTLHVARCTYVRVFLTNLYTVGSSNLGTYPPGVRVT